MDGSKQVFQKSIMMAAVCIFVFCSVVKAEDMENTAQKPQESIEPFGGIRWEDSLLQLIGKLRSIKGIQHIRLHFSDASVDVSKVAKREEMAVKFTELLLKYNPRLFADLQSITEAYVGPNGEKRKYMHLTPKVTAGPIVIAGVPFKLKISLSYEPGLEIVRTDARLIEKRGWYSFPLVISNISLDSTAASLSDKYNDIIQLVEDKYRKYDPESLFLFNQPGSGLDGKVFDTDGRILSVNITSHQASLYYVSDIYQVALREIYRKHLAKIEHKANAGKPDMGTGL